MLAAFRKEEFTLSVSVGPINQGNSKSQNNEDIEAPLIPAGRLLPFLVVTVLFFLWAIPNNLNDILIRQFMKSFNINRSSAAGVQIWFYLGYFLLAIPAGQLMRRFGYKIGIVTGLCLLGTGCLLFYPAAQAGLYTFFLVAQFVIASGLSFLETGSNSFIAQLGPAGSSERRLNLSQAFNPLGSISAGLIGTVFIFSGVKLSDAQVAAMQAAGTYQAYLHSETLRVVAPYLVLALLCVFLGAADPDDQVSGHGDRGYIARARLPAGCTYGSGSRTLCSLCWRSFFTWARRWAHGATSSPMWSRPQEWATRPRATC